MKKPKNLELYGFALATLAAIFTSFYKVFDNVSVKNFVIIPGDKLTAALTLLVLGSWIGFGVGIIFALFFGRKFFDSNFRSIIFSKTSLHLSSCLAGSSAAFATFFYILGSQYGDPGTIIALGNGVLIYTALWESIKKSSSRSILFIAMLVFVGASLATYNGAWEISVIVFVLVMIFSNLFSATGEIVEQYGARTYDTVNYFIWRFFWLAVTSTFISILISLFRGKLSILFNEIQTAVVYLPWFILTMFFVLLSIGFKLVAKKFIGVTAIICIMSVQVILGYFVTFAGTLLIPGVFGDIPTSQDVWVVRIIGSITIIVGILILGRKLLVNSGTSIAR